MVYTLMKSIVYYITLIFSIYFAFEAAAAAKPATTIKEVDDYLASIKSIEARFIQTDSNGGKRDGFIYIKKPNRIRVEYLTPEKELILLNSNLVMHYTPDLDETNYVPGEELAMSLLSQKDFRITKHAKIQRFEVRPKRIKLDFTISTDKQKRQTSLTLTNNPISLVSISMIQGDGFVNIDFVDPIINSKIPGRVFEFENRQIGE